MGSYRMIVSVTNEFKFGKFELIKCTIVSNFLFLNQNLHKQKKLSNNYILQKAYRILKTFSLQLFLNYKEFFIKNISLFGFLVRI